MTVDTFLQIKKILDENKVDYTHLVHEYVHRSVDAAKIRGTKLEEAAKAIILKIEKKDDKKKFYEFIQVVIGGDKRIDLKKIKKIFNTKNASLASPAEVLEKTGCTIGSVPPFGKLFNIPVYLEEDLLKKEYIVFSAGTHNDSIRMKTKDYVKILNPQIIEVRDIKNVNELL